MQQLIQEEIVKMQPKGLVTIPKKLRQLLGFEENSLVKMKEEKGRLVMESVHVLPYPVRNYSKEEVEEFIELDKKETRELKEKGLL